MPTLKKILIVSYYWPPSSGVGVKRWVYFSQELRKQDIEVVVVTPSNPQFNVLDTEAQKALDPSIEVLKLPIWEPFALMQKLTGGKNKNHVKQGLVLEKEKPSFLDQLLIWVRGNLLVPDARRFWVNPASKYIVDYLNKNKVDAVITTGPPHSMHLIGLKVQKKTGVKWVADFRDPWSNWDLLDKLNTGYIAKKLHKNYESKVLHNANLVMATSKRQAEDLKTFGAQKTVCINNGFALKERNILPHQDDVFRISHLGLLNELRNPVEFWETLHGLLLDHPALAEKLQIDLYGIIGDSVKEGFKKWPLLNQKVKVFGYLAQHELETKMQEASVLLVIQNRSINATRIIPYKLYEYLPMQRPILQLGAAFGDSNDLINEVKAGYALDVKNIEMTKKVLLQLFQQWVDKIAYHPNTAIEKYSHASLVKKLILQLEEII